MYLWFVESFSILGYIEGTVNEPTKFPTPNSHHGSSHWAFERAVSAALVPILGATAVTSSHPVLDGLICSSLIIHSHIGFDASLTVSFRWY